MQLLFNIFYAATTNRSQINSIEINIHKIESI